MRLKSGCMFWPQLYRENCGAEPAIRASVLCLDLQCDVAIIGAGISGALAAYHLVRAGVDAVLIDRHEVACGSTAASTGLLQYELDVPLVELARQIGPEDAAAAYRASLEALLGFEPLVEELGDPGGSVNLASRPSLYLASRQEDVRGLQEECAARRGIGIDVQFLDAGQLRERFGLDRPAALWSATAFEVDPYRITVELINRAIEHGLRVFKHTQVDRCRPGGMRIALHTSGGPTIRARKVVYTAGYGAAHLLPPDLCQLASTYALVSEPVPDLRNWPHRCLIWETARPYLYCRTTPDDRVLVGGADEDVVDPAARDRLLDRKVGALRAGFGQLFPRISIDTSCAWAGVFAQTRDGLPYLGALHDVPDIFFTMGYGGNGITFSLLGAWMVVDWFLGRQALRNQLFGLERACHA